MKQLLILSDNEILENFGALTEGLIQRLFGSGYLTLAVKKFVFCQFFQKHFANFFKVLPIFSSFPTDLPPNFQICCDFLEVPDPILDQTLVYAVWKRGEILLTRLPERHRPPTDNNYLIWFDTFLYAFFL